MAKRRQKNKLSAADKASLRRILGKVRKFPRKKKPAETTSSPSFSSSGLQDLSTQLLSAASALGSQIRFLNAGGVRTAAQTAAFNAAGAKFQFLLGQAFIALGAQNGKNKDDLDELIKNAIRLSQG